MRVYNNHYVFHRLGILCGNSCDTLVIVFFKCVCEPSLTFFTVWVSDSCISTRLLAGTKAIFARSSETCHDS